MIHTTLYWMTRPHFGYDSGLRQRPAEPLYVDSNLRRLGEIHGTQSPTGAPRTIVRQGAHRRVVALRERPGLARRDPGADCDYWQLTLDAGGEVLLVARDRQTGTWWQLYEPRRG